MARIAFVLITFVAVACSACSSTSSTRSSAAGTTSTEVIPLQHIDADSAAAQLRAGRVGVRIVTDARTNSIIVAGSQAELEQVRQAVSHLDQPS